MTLRVFGDYTGDKVNYTLIPLGTEQIYFSWVCSRHTPEHVEEAVDLGYLFPDSVLYNLQSSFKHITEKARMEKSRETHNICYIWAV